MIIGRILESRGKQPTHGPIREVSIYRPRIKPEQPRLSTRKGEQLISTYKARYLMSSDVDRPHGRVLETHVNFQPASRYREPFQLEVQVLGVKVHF